MFFINNPDLLSVGISVAAAVILGLIVFFNNWKSASARSFLYLALASVFWGIMNYISAGMHPASASLVALRYTLFIGIWTSFLFFRMAYVFPGVKIVFPRWYRDALLPAVILMSALALTPMVFLRVSDIDLDGRITGIENGPVSLLFMAVVAVLMVWGLATLFTKMKKAKGLLRKQLNWMFSGALASFILIATSDLALPFFWNDMSFVPFRAVLLLPLIISAAVAILKYRLLEFNIIAAEAVVLALGAVSLSEVIAANSLPSAVFESVAFILILIFGTFLIKSLRREARRREELLRLSEQFEKANIQMDELNRLKTQLLSLGSHQVKSPLAAIRGLVSSASNGLYGPIDVKTKDVLVKVGNSTEGLIDLINNLLDVRRADESRMDYHFAKTDVSALVEEVMSLLQPIANSKKISLSFHSNDGKVILSADGEKVKHAIKNLIDNAIKYTAKGSVKVELSKKGNKVELSVMDSGLGMSKDFMPLLFHRFVRDDRVKAKVLGAGLGLYVAKKIVEAHGGRIFAESEGEGKGSKFTMILPVA